MLLNYEVDPALLNAHVPAGTELDLLDGRCFVSLVGFLFQHTRLRGIPIPFHRTFEEVNLRYYVVRRDPRTGTVKRGVAFFQEIVPLPAVTAVARWAYGEPYRTRRMRHEWAEDGDHLRVEYKWKRLGRWNRMKVVADREARAFKPGSAEEFITEHYWGYIRLDPHRTREYEVRHPPWRVHEVLEHSVDVDFDANYGPAFAHLGSKQPASVMLAEGSPVQVWPRILLSP